MLHKGLSLIESRMSEIEMDSLGSDFYRKLSIFKLHFLKKFRILYFFCQIKYEVALNQSESSRCRESSGWSLTANQSAAANLFIFSPAEFNQLERS